MTFQYCDDQPLVTITMDSMWQFAIFSVSVSLMSNATIAVLNQIQESPRTQWIPPKSICKETITSNSTVMKFFCTQSVLNSLHVLKVWGLSKDNTDTVSTNSYHQQYYDRGWATAIMKCFFSLLLCLSLFYDSQISHLFEEFALVALFFELFLRILLRNTDALEMWITDNAWCNVFYVTLKRIDMYVQIAGRWNSFFN